MTLFFTGHHVCRQLFSKFSQLLNWRSSTHLYSLLEAIKNVIKLFLPVVSFEQYFSILHLYYTFYSIKTSVMDHLVSSMTNLNSTFVCFTCHSKSSSHDLNIILQLRRGLNFSLTVNFAICGSLIISGVILLVFSPY